MIHVQLLCCAISSGVSSSSHTIRVPKGKSSSGHHLHSARAPFKWSEERVLPEFKFELTELHCFDIL